MATVCRIDKCTKYILADGACHKHSDFRTDKLCSLENCTKGHYAKELCHYHWKIKHYDCYPCATKGCFKLISSGKHCSTHKCCQIAGCGNKYSAKGYCHTHYEYFRKNPTGRYGKKICSVKECKKGIWSTSDREFCARHQAKFRKGLSPHKKYNNKGKRNGMWKGGVSEYRNHYAMKKMRLEKLKQVGCKCEHCGKQRPKKRLQLHHLDKSKNNHSIENFKLLCGKCHKGIYHKGDWIAGRKAKKYQGVPLRDIANHAECAYGTVNRHLFSNKRSLRYGDAIEAYINKITVEEKKGSLT